jgi:hypothetical protein
MKGEFTVSFILVLVILVVVVAAEVFIYRKSKSAQNSIPPLKPRPVARNEEPDVTYVCKICGERDCICHKKDKPEGSANGS